MGERFLHFCVPAFLLYLCSYDSMLPWSHVPLLPCSCVPAFLLNLCSYDFMLLWSHEPLLPCSRDPIFLLDSFTCEGVWVWALGPLFRCSINIQSSAVLTGVCGLVCMYFTQVMSGHFFIPEPFVTVTFVLLPKYIGMFLSKNWQFVARFTNKLQ